MKKLCLVCLTLLLLTNICLSQIHDYSFVKNNSIVFKDSTGKQYLYPLTGGMNACQFSAIDLNNDGIKDLFVFDKHGDRVLTFINNGTPDSVDYVYAPQYELAFPQMHAWATLVDYNNDGKEDIFTYTTGGIRVFKNVSNGSLQFQLAKDPILSYYGSTYTNIFCLTETFPAIADIDGDGDIDILNYWVLGEFVNYNKNYSMEDYGVPDSLDFKMVENSWGCFAESPYSNQITLDTCTPGKSLLNKSDTPPKHTGSTLLATDLNGDGIQDLIVGNVGYPNLIKLTNNGTLTTAHISTQDTLFPSNTLPVNLWSFALPSYIDINNDGKKDILISTFDPNEYLAETYKSVWLYKNIGTNSSPVFKYVKEDFLQDEMIDVGTGAYPVFFDYDNDGLKDLFIGNMGYRDTSYTQAGYSISKFTSKIALFKNIGTASNPQFKLITRDFANVSALNILGAYPTFGDINGDGKAEMIVGSADGSLYLYVNNAPTGSTPNFVLSQSNYQGINVGSYAAPQLFDLNKDGLLDLIIGNRGTIWKDSLGNIITMKGNLFYYKNTGTAANPVFTLVTDSLGGIDVTNFDVSNYGYSTPCFFRTATNETRLFVGNNEGKVIYYKNIDNNLNGNFTIADTLSFIDNTTRYIIDEGNRSGVAVADINNDGYLDIMVGNQAGGIAFYKGAALNTGITPTHDIVDNKLSVYPNPAKDMIHVNYECFDNTHITTVEVMDITGRNVLKTDNINRNNLTINISSLNKGSYICKVTFSNSATTNKILIKL